MYLVYEFRDLDRAGQGLPRAKVMMPIDSPGVVSYSTSIDPIVVSVTVFDIFDIIAIFPQEQCKN